MIEIYFVMRKVKHGFSIGYHEDLWRMMFNLKHLGNTVGHIPVGYQIKEVAFNASNRCNVPFPFQSVKRGSANITTGTVFIY